MAVVERLGGCCHGRIGLIDLKEMRGITAGSVSSEYAGRIREIHVGRQRESKKQNQNCNRGSLNTAIDIRTELRLQAWRALCIYSVKERHRL
jgi:hypothetical protein